MSSHNQDSELDELERMAREALRAQGVDPDAASSDAEVPLSPSEPAKPRRRRASGAAADALVARAGTSSGLSEPAVPPVPEAAPMPQAAPKRRRASGQEADDLVSRAGAPTAQPPRVRVAETKSEPTIPEPVPVAPIPRIESPWLEPAAAKPPEQKTAGDEEIIDRETMEEMRGRIESDLSTLSQMSEPELDRVKISIESFQRFTADKDLQTIELHCFIADALSRVESARLKLRNGGDKRLPAEQEPTRPETELERELRGVMAEVLSEVGLRPDEVKAIDFGKIWAYLKKVGGTKIDLKDMLIAGGPAIVVAGILRWTLRTKLGWAPETAGAVVGGLFGLARGISAEDRRQQTRRTKYQEILHEFTATGGFDGLWAMADKDILKAMTTVLAMRKTVEKAEGELDPARYQELTDLITKQEILLLRRKELRESQGVERLVKFMAVTRGVNLDGLQSQRKLLLHRFILDRTVGAEVKIAAGQRRDYKAVAGKAVAGAAIGWSMAALTDLLFDWARVRFFSGAPAEAAPEGAGPSEAPTGAEGAPAEPTTPPAETTDTSTAPTPTEQPPAPKPDIKAAPAPAAAEPAEPTTPAAGDLERALTAASDRAQDIVKEAREAAAAARAAMANAPSEQARTAAELAAQKAEAAAQAAERAAAEVGRATTREAAQKALREVAGKVAEAQMEQQAAEAATAAGKAIEIAGEKIVIPGTLMDVTSEAGKNGISYLVRDQLEYIADQVKGNAEVLQKIFGPSIDAADVAERSADFRQALREKMFAVLENNEVDGKTILKLDEAGKVISEVRLGAADVNTVSIEYDPSNPSGFAVKVEPPTYVEPVAPAQPLAPPAEAAASPAAWPRKFSLEDLLKFREAVNSPNFPESVDKLGGHFNLQEPSLPPDGVPQPPDYLREDFWQGHAPTKMGLLFEAPTTAMAAARLWFLGSMVSAGLYGAHEATQAVVSRVSSKTEKTPGAGLAPEAKKFVRLRERLKAKDKSRMSSREKVVTALIYLNPKDFVNPGERTLTPLEFYGDKETPGVYRLIKNHNWPAVFNRLLALKLEKGPEKRELIDEAAALLGDLEGARVAYINYKNGRQSKETAAIDRGASRLAA